MKISIGIKGKDTKKVAKIVFVNRDNEVLMLKRNRFHKKHPGEWDFPGGHIVENESLLAGLKREVKEETSLEVVSASFFKKNKNLYFFYSNLPIGDIKLSREHTKFAFFPKEKLNIDDKFQKIALEVMESVKNEF